MKKEYKLPLAEMMLKTVEDIMVLSGEAGMGDENDFNQW